MFGVSANRIFSNVFLFLLQFFFVIDENFHSVFFQVSQLCIVDLSKDLNILPVALYKSDELLCVLFVEMLESFDELF